MLILCHWYLGAGHPVALHSSFTDRPVWALAELGCFMIVGFSNGWSLTGCDLSSGKKVIDVVIMVLHLWLSGNKCSTLLCMFDPLHRSSNLS